VLVPEIAFFLLYFEQQTLVGLGLLSIAQSLVAINRVVCLLLGCDVVQLLALVLSAMVVEGGERSVKYLLSKLRVRQLSTFR